MTRLTGPLLPLAVITLAACASSATFDRTGMHDVMRQTVNLSAPQTAAAGTDPAPTIAAPFRLGILFSHKEFPIRQALRPAEWLSQDKDVLLRALAPLQDQHILRDIIVIAPSAIQNTSLPEIRKAAARYGADLIVVVTGVGAVDRYNNGYAAFYPTILGAYLAPGTVSEALFMIDGSLWDVRSGVAYGTVAAEDQAKLVGPAMSVEDRDALMQGKNRALETFGLRLVEQLRRLADTQPPSSQPSR